MSKLKKYPQLDEVSMWQSCSNLATATMKSLTFTY